MADAAVKVTSNIDKTKLDTLRGDTTGTVTVADITEDKTDLGTISKYADVDLKTANITVSDNVNKAEADTIDGYNSTSGTVTLSTVTDTFANIKLLHEDTSISIASAAVTVTNAASLALSLIHI